jgi:predicted flap endonuclease-1-like 5' DNA nuclease
MNPLYVIGAFTLILAVVVYWLQVRQNKADEEEIKRVTPKKEISIVKKADWVADEEPEAVAEPEPEQIPEPEQAEEPVSEPEPEATPEPKPEEETVPEPMVDDISELAGVGPKYRQLLKAAGITSIAVVAGSEPEELLKKLADVNESEGITKRNPTMYVVQRWIEAAKGR